MICWYCHWGWSRAVVDIYQKYIGIAGKSAMHFGPAHIVWEDENFEREHVQWCLDHFDEYRNAECNGVEHAAVRLSLIDLLKLSDEQLCPEPADYDGENPEKYPPKVEVTRP